MSQINELQKKIRQGAELAKRAEKMLRIADKGISNRKAIGNVISRTIKAGSDAIQDEFLGDQND